MNLVFDSLVKIYSDENTLRGVGFVVKQEDDISYVLTCNHVVYKSDNDTKHKIKVDDVTIVEESDITYGHEKIDSPVDLALIKVKQLKSKISISLQATINESSQHELITFDKLDNDINSFDSKSMELFYKDSEPLNYCHTNSKAYLFAIDTTIKGGYSGSPVLDTKTNKVVAILNMVRAKEEESCKGLSIDNILKVFPELEDELKVKEKKNSKITVLFKPVNGVNTYDIILNNNDEKFKNIDVLTKDETIKEKLKAELIDTIYALTNRLPNRTIEFFLPPSLFSENIHLWESSRGKRLSNKHLVYYRSLNLSKTSGDLKEYWEKKWKKDMLKHKNRVFESSLTPIDTNKIFHPDIVSALFHHDVDLSSNDFDDLEEDFISIAIWNNTCDDHEYYDEFIEILKKENFQDFTQGFKGKIFEHKKYCSSNTALMWDNPYDLPKKDFKNA